MTTEEYLKHWQITASEDLQTAKSLFKLKRFHHCLFFCHLALEKIIKGLVYKNTKKHALPIHNLLKLSQQAKIQIDDVRQKELEEISTWNIQARYDDIKREFYKKASNEFAKLWLVKVESLYLWFKKQY